MYTAYNLWWEKPEALWCINYKTGNMIPAGTPVRNVDFSRAQARGAERRALSFETAADGRKYWVNIRGAFHPGKSIEDYRAMLFTEKTFEQLTAGFAAAEIDAIKEGIVIEGMSKQGVLVSYGYPPEHKTPALDSDRWLFWMNRFRSKAICFDENDAAVACQQENSNAL